MITDKEIERWFNDIIVSEKSELEAKHVYAMAEIAYKKGVADGAKSGREACAALLESTDLSGAPDNMRGWIANMLIGYVKAMRMISNV